jgi:flagellar protein FlaG
VLASNAQVSSRLADTVYTFSKNGTGCECSRLTLAESTKQKECVMSLTSIATSTAGAHPVVAPAAALSATSNRTATPAVTPDQAPARRSSSKSTAAELQQAIEASNKVLAAKTSNELQFAMERDTGLSVVKLINRQSGETVLQFPSEAILQIAKGIDQVTGAIIQRKA